MNRTKADGKFDPTGQRNIFFNNILLLGFEPGAMEAKHSIPFTKDMFAMPNKKAFEVVMHFLLNRLNPALAKERFRVCYPICDKKQDQLFRRAVTHWLTEITKDDHEAYLPRISPSLLMSPSGDKFYSLLLHLSAHVLLTVARSSHGLKGRDLLQRPRLVPSSIHLGGVMAKTVGASVVRHRKRFLDQLQETTAMQDQWLDYAAELTKEHRTITKSIRGVEKKLHDLYDKANQLAKERGSPPPIRRRQSGDCFEGEPEVQAIRRTKKVQKVRELWKSVNELYNVQKPERDVLQSILDGAANRFKLDASNIHIHIPEMLLRECEKELQRRNLSNTYEGGKLNLVTLIQLWNLSLHLYLEQLNQASLPDFGELSPTVIRQVHDHHTHLVNTQALRSNLSVELLPELKESIANLTEQIETLEDSTLKQHPFLGSSKNMFDNLTLLPSTPPVSFQPDTILRDATPKELARTLLQRSPDILDTPEATTLLRSVIDKEALKHAGLEQGTPVSTAKHLMTNIGSKLPKPIKTVEGSGIEERKRVKSAPSKAQSTPIHCQPLKQHMVTPKGSNRKSWHQTIGNQTVKANRDSRKGMINTDFKKKPKREHRNHHHPKSAIKAATTNNRKIAEDNPVYMDSITTVVATPISDFNASINRKPDWSARRPAIRHEIHTRTPVMSTAKSTAAAAHLILAEQIANAVAGTAEDGNTPLALDDPLAALATTPFTTRDKLGRTPENTEKMEEDNEMNSMMPTKKLFDDSLMDSPNVQKLGSSEFSEKTSVSKEFPVEKNVPTEKLIDVQNSSSYSHKESPINFVEKNSQAMPQVDKMKEFHPKLDLELQTLDSPLLATPEGLNDFQSDLSEIFASKTPILPLRSRQRLEARKDSSVDSPITESIHTSNLLKTPLSIENELHARSMKSFSEMPVGSSSSPGSDLSDGIIANDHLQTRLSVRSSELSDESVTKSTLKYRTHSGDSQKSVHFSDDCQESINDNVLINKDESQVLSFVKSTEKRNNLSLIFSEDECFDLDKLRPVEDVLHHFSPGMTPVNLQRHGEMEILDHDSPFDITKHDATVSLLERLKLNSDIKSPIHLTKSPDRLESSVSSSLHDDADERLILFDDDEWNKSSDFDLLDDGDDSILMLSSPMQENYKPAINHMHSPVTGSDSSSIIQMTSPKVGQLIDI